MSVRVGCPYCNHRVVLPAVPPTGRAACDRCGEQFPVTGDVEQVADAPPPAADDPRPATPLRWYGLAGLVLAVGLLAVGLAVVRQSPAPQPPVTPPSAGPVTWPPAAVPLLAHLPPDTGLAVAVQPGPLLAHAKRTDTDPQRLLAGLGVPDRAFATLAGLGLSLDRIDLLAAGLAFPADNAIPRAVLGVRLTDPPGDLLAKLKAEREKVANGRQRYRAVLGGLPVKAEERDGVWVFATADGDLDRPAIAGSGHLPAGLRDSLTRLSPSAFAWAATDSADWAGKPTVQLAAKALSRPDLLDRLRLGRAAAAGLSLEPGLTAKLAVRAAGDDKGLQERVAAAVAGKEVLVGGGDGWVTLTADPAAVPGLVGR